MRVLFTRPVAEVPVDADAPGPGLVVGAVHIAQPLVAMAAVAGFAEGHDDAGDDEGTEELQQPAARHRIAAVELVAHVEHASRVVTLQEQELVDVQ